MRQQFEHFYAGELDYIRNLSREFANARPKIADRLWLDPSNGVSEDPHVERLIQAFAFLTARIRLKLEDEFPELTEALLGILYPHYLAPVPSMGVCQFVVDPYQGGLDLGEAIPRDTTIYTPVVDDVRCRFSTGYPVTLWPIKITSEHYQIAPFSEYDLPTLGHRSKSLIRIELESIGVDFGAIQMDSLRLFLGGELGLGHELYELLLDRATHVVIRSPENPKDSTVALGPEAIQPVGFGKDEGLLNYDRRTFTGYRLLTEYFCFPQKFLFVDISGIRKSLERCAGNKVEIFILLDHEDTKLESRVEQDTFRLGCAPIVNLFRMVADGIRLTQTKSEYHVIPDGRHLSAYEVFSVDALSGVDVDTGESVEYQPLYSCRHGMQHGDDNHYWYCSRRPSPRKKEDGTVVYVSLVNLEFNPSVPSSEVLNPHVTATNGTLPSEVRAAGGVKWGFQLEGQASIKQILPVVLPTPPKPQALDEQRWRVISHLGMNHLSITDGDDGAAALREILTLYDYASTRATVQHIDGVTSVNSRRKTARIPAAGPVGFCRGVEIEVELDPEKFVGTGSYLFSSVLDHFLASYTSINSFTQLITRIKGSKEPDKRWPRRIGEQVFL